MKPLTVYLGRLLGLFTLITSFWLLTERQNTLSTIPALLGDRPAMVIFAIIALAGGLAIVLAHNISSGGVLPILVTLIGWVMLIRGVLFLFLHPALPPRIAVTHSAIATGDQATAQLQRSPDRAPRLADRRRQALARYRAPSTFMANWCSILGQSRCTAMLDRTNHRRGEPMKTNHKLILAVLAGAAMGVLGAMAIHAQGAKTAPGFVIAEVEVHDATTFAKYGAKVPDTLKPFNGHYLVRGGKVEGVEGTASKDRFVVIAFDSAEKARAWENSAAYEAIKPIRHSSATSRVFIVEGVAP